MDEPTTQNLYFVAFIFSKMFEEIGVCVWIENIMQWLADNREYIQTQKAVHNGYIRVIDQWGNSWQQALQEQQAMSQGGPLGLVGAI